MPLLHFVSGARAFCSCLTSGQMRQASVLAHQGVQEGSGTCNFFSNGYYGQVMCMWTGLVALGAGLRHDEHPTTFSYIKHERSVQFSPVFKPNRRHNDLQRQKMCPFRAKGRFKKHANDRTRPVSTRDGPLDQPNKQKAKRPTLCRFFYELSR